MALNVSSTADAVVMVDHSGMEVPVGGTPVGASSGDVAATAAIATLPAVVGKTNYLTSITITGTGATATSTVVATITGLAGGTQSLVIVVPAGATTALTPLHLIFPTALAGSGDNVAITVTVPSLGAGNLHSCVNINGCVR